ncbi:MAG: iron-dicitrate transporter ATP-binding subunit [Chloroflexi bacterium 54-19]|nr:MAG: iron-dicitrate transporter ATP-binding subunit [Chloroflexi bacterium 54-19]
MAAENVRVGYGEKIILSELSLEIRRGEITALVGPNGSGKSTLLKGMARLLKLHSGTVFLEGEELTKMANSEIARRLAVLPQAPTAPAGLTVGELVEQGRYPHAGPMRMLRKQDHEAIGRALELTGTLEFANRPLENLSGGERQRAWIALTLAQATPVLFLDEPTTFLDIGHQLEVLELVGQLNREQGMTIVMVLHDLNQAAQYAHRMVVLRKGSIVADGAPAEVMTGEVLEKVFNIKAHIVTDPASGRPVFLPYAVVKNEEVGRGQ